MGRVQLARLPGMLEQRVEMAEAYTEAIRDIAGLEPPHVPEYARTNYQSYAVRVTLHYPLGRDELMGKLLRLGISTRRGIMNAHQEGPYLSSCPGELPCSETAGFGDPVAPVPWDDARRPAAGRRSAGRLGRRRGVRSAAWSVRRRDAPPRFSRFLTMPQPLIILGTGGSAYDLLDIVEASNAVSPAWHVAGFLDDGREPGSRHLGIEVLGGLRDACRLSGYRFVNVIGSDKNYGRRPDILGSTGLSADQFVTLIHPKAAVSSHARLARGVYVAAGASISGGVEIGDHVSVSPGAIVGHDTVIEEYAMIAPGAVVSGFVRVGRCAYVGAGALLRQHVRIGAWALVGMGAVVLRDVPAETTVIGNPARLLSR